MKRLLIPLIVSLALACAACLPPAPPSQLAPVIVSGPSGAVRTPTVTFRFLVVPLSASASLRCQIDSAETAPCASGSATYTGLADGTHTFSVSAGTGPTQRTFRVDTHPPVSIVSFSTNSDWPTGGVSIFQSQPYKPRFGCLDFIDSDVVGLPSAQCHTDLTDDTIGIGRTSALGHYTFTVTAVDDAGNTSTTGPFPFDIVAPDVAIDSPAAALFVREGASVTFRFHAIPPNGGFSCQMNAVGFGPCTSPLTLFNVSNPVVVLTVRGQYGGIPHESVGQVGRAVLVDVTPPTVSLISPADGAVFFQGQSVAASYTCDDPRSSDYPQNAASGIARTTAASAVFAAARPSIPRELDHSRSPSLPLTQSET